MSTNPSTSAFNISVATAGQVRRPNQTDDRASASNSKKMVNPYHAKKKAKAS